MPVLKDRGYGCGEWMTRSDPLGDVLAERERAAKVTGPTDIPTVEPAPPASEQLSRHREEIEQAANQHRRKPRR